MKKSIWSRKEAAEVTGIPDRRVLFYSEQGMLPRFHLSVGRGVAREYELRHLFFLGVIKELNLLGLSLSWIRGVVDMLYVASMPVVEQIYDDVKLPKMWDGDEFTKKKIYMVISICEIPVEHEVSLRIKKDGSQTYLSRRDEPPLGPENTESEMFISFPVASTTIKELSERSSCVILNLNKIFNNLNLKE